MTQKTLTRSLPDVTADFRFAMLVVASGEPPTTTLTSRPLTLLETEGDVLRFLVDATAAWTAAADGSPVHVALADPGKNAFASVTGAARMRHEPDLVRRLYNPEADVFFDGPDDPRVRVLEVTASSGEWWDGPSGRIGEAVALLRAKVTHDESKVGDSGAIDLR